MQVFISHSSKEAEIANEVCSIIENNGDSCFIAPRDIRSGYEYAEEIINGIDSSNAMILLLSEESNKSPHVLREVERAVSKSIPIIVYQLENVVLTKSMEYFLMTHQWISNNKRKIEILTCLDQIRYKEAVSDLSLANNYSVKKNDGKKKKKKKSKDTKWIPWFLGAILLVLIFLILLIIVLTSDIDNDSNNNTNLNKSSSEEGKNNNSSENDSEDIPDVKLGDSITLGKYNDESIVWRVLKINDDNTAILVSDQILSMKPFDVAESGEYNYDGAEYYWDYEWDEYPDYELEAMVRGNNLWYISNIRTWLNSNKEVVKYEDQEPADYAAFDYINGYASEPGFLHDFTEEELDMLVEIDISTFGGELGGNAKIKSKDKVFLLSEDELEWFEDADISIFTTPTKQAIENDDINSYELYSLDYNVKNYYWLLREPVNFSGSEIYMVSNGYDEEDIVECIAAVGNFGIRPAIAVDLTKLAED